MCYALEFDTCELWVRLGSFALRTIGVALNKMYDDHNLNVVDNWNFEW